MTKASAGLLLCRHGRDGLEVFLVHPGEDPLAAARREFTEETGFTASGDFVPLTPLKQPSGKVVHAWGIEGDYDPALVRSNTFEFKGREYPEIDRAAWFGLAEARKKILRGQVGFLDELDAQLH